MSKEPSNPEKTTSERIAKVIARAGVCSRREAEAFIAAGRVSVNGTMLTTPAFTVRSNDRILIDGQPLPQREPTRLFLFHKPKGIVTTTRDPQGRPTVFDILPSSLPRLMTVGRLDINTEGLLLLTNDGGLARTLELPATGWLRRYRVRAHGDVEQETLDTLKAGIAIDGILYGSVDAVLDSRKGDNVWMTIGLREGKNREIKKILEYLGLDVNRLIRLSFGPFELADLPSRMVVEVPRGQLKKALGPALITASGADFSAPLKENIPAPSPQPAPVTRPPDAKKARLRHQRDLEHNATAQARGKSFGKKNADRRR